MIRKLINFLTGSTDRLRSEDLQRQIAEIDRKLARITPAYNLQAEVILKYGIEYAPYLTDPEIIIEDTKTITMVNYFDTSCLTFTI